MTRTPHAASAWLRRSPLLTGLTATAVAGIASLALAGTASASSSQISIIQDDQGLQQNPTVTAETMRELGAGEVRVLMYWYQVAPKPNSKTKPSGFTATNPNAKGYDWSAYDTEIDAAHAAGLKVDLVITGAPPKWAQGKGVPTKDVNKHYGFDPNTSDYAQFVAAVTKRYDGKFKPTGATTAQPQVTTFALWNEPNFGQNLSPQATGATTKFDGYDVAAGYYRNLVRAAYPKVKANDPKATVLIGELAGQGRSGVVNRAANHPQGLPGDYAITSPIPYLQTLYCVNSSYQRLTGEAAKKADCPTTAAAARKFKSQNPALFKASAFSSHPYASTHAPNSTAGIGKQAIVLQVIGRLETELKKLTKHYGAGRNWPIYSTEYGFITNPPQTNTKKDHYPSPATAAIYLNEAEYLSYKKSYVKSYSQYLLTDPQNLKSEGVGLFASGLIAYGGKDKPGFDAWRLPIWLTKESGTKGTAKVSSGASTAIWGGARPAPFSAQAASGTQSVQVQFKAKGSGTWTTMSTVTVNKTTGYFTTHAKFTKSGSLRLAYAYPTTAIDLPIGVAGSTVYSRTVPITVK